MQARTRQLSWSAPAVLVALVGCSSAPAPVGSSDDALATAISMKTALNDARNAGLSCNANLVIAGAIAMAESSLIPDNFATNGPTSGCPDGSTDRGIWQINSCYQSEYSTACVYDPACNAKAMVVISSTGTNWHPWGSYNSGRYKQYLPAAQAAFNEVCSAPPAPPPPSPLPSDDAGAGSASCAGLGDGLYCGADSVGGDPGTLYQCSGQSISVAQICADGCAVEPPDQNDACN